jgi:hypothetical protein
VRSAALSSLIALTLAAAGRAAQPADVPGRPASRLAQIVAGARADLDGFWKEQVSKYRPLAEVRSYTPGQTAPCRMSEDDNAYFCKETRGIYYDEKFLQKQLDTVGRFAVTLVVAHEWGHYVQHLLGLLDATSGLWPIEEELQADCLAGAYARNARARGTLEPNALAQALQTLYAIADNQTPWFDPEAHGRPGQRIDAFTEGFEGRPCTAVEFFDALGLDLRSTVQPPVPTRGSLQELLPIEVGRFKRESVRHSPALISAGATEMVETRYRASDGVDVTVTLIAFGSLERSRKAGETLETAARGSRAFVQRQTVLSAAGATLGSIAVFQGATEVAIWTNGRVVGMVEGPRDYAWELATRII